MIARQENYAVEQPKAGAGKGASLCGLAAGEREKMRISRTEKAKNAGLSALMRLFGKLRAETHVMKSTQATVTKAKGKCRRMRCVGNRFIRFIRFRFGLANRGFVGEIDKKFGLFGLYRFLLERGKANGLCGKLQIVEAVDWFAFARISSD